MNPNTKKDQDKEQQQRPGMDKQKDRGTPQHAPGAGSDKQHPNQDKDKDME